MKKEIDFAVENFHRIAFGTKKHGHKYISESKLASFVTILTELLFKRYEKNWYPTNPDRGSGYRCIRINTQSFDPTIKESMDKAKIVLPSDFQMTQEVTIWVDPGVVSVRIGEDGSIGSEIIDEEVYKLGKVPQIVESPVKRLGSVDDDDCSSRSSTPDSKASDRSTSPLLTLSMNPRNFSASPEPEYNPYNPPSRVTYPQRFRQIPSPPSSLGNFSSSPPLMNTSPNRAFHQMAAANQARSPLSSRGSPVSFSSQRDASQSARGYIPQGAHRNMTYNRPSRPITSNSDNSSHFEGLKSYSPYSMSMGYDRNLQAANLYDIPAMA